MIYYNYIDLFSGVGGFALGAKWAGMEWNKHYYSDIDDYANKVYQKRFPDAISLGDITKIKIEDLPNDAEWIITGGFPCTDISFEKHEAEGINGCQSGLWSEMFRVIRGVRPKFIIIENVSAITIRGFDRVLSNLAEIGYDAEWTIIRASDIGAPHKRERIWIIGYPSKENVSDSESEGLEGEESKGVLSRRGNGLPAEFSWWESEPEFCRVVNGIPSRVDRLKCLGNSIVPQIAHLLFTMISNIEMR